MIQFAKHIFQVGWIHQLVKRCEEQCLPFTVSQIWRLQVLLMVQKSGVHHLIWVNFPSSTTEIIYIQGGELDTIPPGVPPRSFFWLTDVKMYKVSKGMVFQIFFWVIYYLNNKHVAWISMVGRCIPYWNSPFLGDMLPTYAKCRRWTCHVVNQRCPIRCLLLHVTPCTQRCFSRCHLLTYSCVVPDEHSFLQPGIFTFATKWPA